METLPGVVSIPLSDLVYAVIQQTHSHLLSLPQRLVHLRDFDRRAAIRQFVAASRTLLARLLVVVRWAQEQRHLIHACASDVHRIEQQRAQLRSAADEFYFLQNAAPQLGKTGLWQACAPPYDVRAALDIIQRGTYTQLPRCIDLSAERAVPAAREQAAALEWTHRVLRLRRCAWLLPEGVAVRDGRGCVIASVPGEYEIALSAYPPASGPWKVMRLRPWAQHDKHAAAGVGGGVSGRAWRSLWQRMQQLLDEAPEAQRAQPLLTIHAELHARCSQVLLDSLQRQAASLARGTQQAALLVLPARSHGIILRHEPPLLCLADGASSGAVTRPPSISTSISTSISISEALDAEALVAGAIRERSMRHLKRCAESLDEAAKAAPATSEVEIEGGLVNGSQPRQRQPATAEAPPATATPAAPVGEGMHEGLDEGHTLPMLRFSSGAALALQPRDATIHSDLLFGRAGRSRVPPDADDARAWHGARDG
ncbi:mediator of RNA polymerase ii transcription subunit [Chrysochromulina tobinii]|uniref:Mediator of RNA polymerase II transcription subunit 14 n=1 Tax=Chrysochromulina tobinii TaxID=1460289 RepID=A0A0M0JMA5_9EUKA|nr:mediator of RNA polymerase ii transcription subunit [Chrysochromulina tobinii]|eukprot:KOO27620.1 mediator of RNA polymerase ii transcription subunit [Chrysochromulina sp. CCMP291]